jgi:hypothetical protein
MGGFGGLVVMALGIRKALSLASTTSVPLRPAMATSRSGSPEMQMKKKLYSFDNEGLWEGREVSYEREPIKLLTRLNEMEAATAISNLKLLSAAEKAGVFSKLENAGAFSFAEKFLPFVDKFKLLSILQRSADTDASIIYTISGFLLAFTPTIFALTISGFVPAPEGLFIPVEGAVCGGTFALGVAIFPIAYFAGVLQYEDASLR